MEYNHVPKVIDEDLYNQLQTLKDGPKRDEYIADLKTRLSQKAVDAAVMHLDDAIRRADEFKAKGRTSARPRTHRSASLPILDCTFS